VLVVLSASSLLGPPPLSKKELWLADKGARHDVRLTHKPPTSASPVLTLHNVWTQESLPVPLTTTRSGDVPLPLTAPPPAPPPGTTAPFEQLARDHYTNQAARMDGRLFQTVLRAAQRFHARYVEIVSGFRAPKYQLLLRKKGHEVARESQHPLGQAVDFRIPSVQTTQLLRFVKSLHLGGVGYYPESKFVHADVGRVRFWRGH
jgi:hypothetical protein